MFQAISCLKKSRPSDIDFSTDDIQNLKSSIQKLKEEVDNIPMNKDAVNTQSGGYVFSLLEKAGVR